MTVKVRLPANMREFACEQSVVEQAGNTVQQVFDNLVAQYPDIRSRLLDSEGNLHSFVNVFLGDENIRDLQDLQTAVPADSEILIIAALAGG